MIRKVGEKLGKNYFLEVKEGLNFNKEGVVNSSRCCSRVGKFRDEERLLDLVAEVIVGFDGCVLRWMVGFVVCMEDKEVEGTCVDCF